MRGLGTVAKIYLEITATCFCAAQNVTCLAISHTARAADFIVRMRGNPFPFLFHDVLSEGAASSQTL